MNSGFFSDVASLDIPTPDEWADAKSILEPETEHWKLSEHLQQGLNWRHLLTRNSLRKHAEETLTLYAQREDAVYQADATRTLYAKDYSQLLRRLERHDPRAQQNLCTIIQRLHPLEQEEAAVRRTHNAFKSSYDDLLSQFQEQGTALNPEIPILYRHQDAVDTIRAIMRIKNTKCFSVANPSSRDTQRRSYR